MMFRTHNIRRDNCIEWREEMYEKNSKHDNNINKH